MHQDLPEVHLIDDDDSARESLEILLRSSGLDVKSYPSAVRWLDQHDVNSVSCVVADIRMPGIDGIELQRIMLDQNIETPVIFISGDADVSTASQVLRSGAIDLLEKPVDGEILLQRIEDALEQSRRIVSRKREQNRVIELLSSLTERESEVLPFIHSGSSLKQIASHFGVTVPTASRHQSRVFDKLGVDSVADLIRLLDAAGVIVGKNG
ncbi:MAG: response regulator [Planctomycetota bacterium]